MTSPATKRPASTWYAAAISEPLRWIAANAGLEGAVVVQKVSGLGTNRGFNAETGDYEDLLAAGVVDPVKVTKAALRQRGQYRRHDPRRRRARSSRSRRGLSTNTR